MQYNFDKVTHRKGTNSIKYDYVSDIFGTDDIIPMWVADMDFEVPPEVSNAIQERARHTIYGYSVKPDRFNESVQSWLKNRHDWEVEADWLSFVPGVVPTLALAVLSLTEPGDQIIIQSPVYFPFYNVIKGNHRKLLNNQLIYKNGSYHIDFDHLESLIDDKTKMLLLCSPHNPVGRVWSKEELLKLGEICLKHNITIVSDEIHQDIVYEPYKHIPTASLSEELAQITITAVAPSKTFNLAGLAASVAIIPNKKIKHKFDRILNSLHLNLGNAFGTIALQEAYFNGAEWLDELLGYLKNNYRFIKETIHKEMPRIKVVEPEATFLLWLDFRDYQFSDKELKEFMINKAKIAMNDGPMFGPGGEGFQRMNFGTQRSRIESALANLQKALKQKAD